ncbi:DUF6804 family protein [Pedobacter sp.]|uniref:DUF6804 family protein n=1 Tax=Pedobacter sp. TaxID=1411316 RepID=UPI003BA90856
MPRKTIYAICAFCCFLAILKLPIGYYTFLRYAISIGALFAISNSVVNKNFYWIAIFSVILTLFNPIFPIYLRLKMIWIIFDAITGILFLGILFIQKKPGLPGMIKMNEEVTKKLYTRDRIIYPKK